MIEAMHYLNGKWVHDNELVIPVRDLSVIRGFGVFDYLRTYKNKPFRIDAHINRFYNSAEILGLKIPVTKDELKEIVQKGLDVNPFPEKGIRMILTGGVSDDLISPSTPSLIVCFYEFKEPSQDQYVNGVKVITVPHARHIPAAKSLSYLVAVLAQKSAKEVGAIEALYVNSVTTEIYEATTSNIFVVKDGRVLTPKDEILTGTTRNVVIELCKQEKIPVDETPIYLKDLSKFDEAFLTAANKEVLPVTAIDDQTVGDGKVGPISKLLEEKFKQKVVIELGLDKHPIKEAEPSSV